MTRRRAVARARLGDALRIPLEGRLRAVEARIADALTGGGPVLDVACGTGLLRRAAGDRPWTGLDADAGSLVWARRRALRPDDEVVRGDATQLPFEDGAFAHVLCHGLIHHLDDVEARAALEEMARVCAPDGAVLVMDLIHDGAPPLRRWLYALDAGKHIRTAAALRAIVGSAVEIARDEEFTSGVNLKLLLAGPPR